MKRATIGVAAAVVFGAGVRLVLDWLVRELDDLADARLVHGAGAVDGPASGEPATEATAPVPVAAAPAAIAVPAPRPRRAA